MLYMHGEQLPVLRNLTGQSHCFLPIPHWCIPILYSESGSYGAENYVITDRYPVNVNKESAPPPGVGPLQTTVSCEYGFSRMDCGKIKIAGIIGIAWKKDFRFNRLPIYLWRIWDSPIMNFINLHGS